MKQVIRLTESDLHRVIKESVRQIISELDWRTYQSAYEKSNNNPQRASKFRQAADNAFNRENAYGMTNIPFGDGDTQQIQYSNGDVYGGGNLYTNQGNQFITKSGRVNQNGDELDKKYTTQKIATQSLNKGKSNRGENVPLENDEQPNATNLNPMRKIKQMQGDKQVKDYFNGKSKYQKGKGWS